MDSSFMQILTQYGLDYQRFEAFDITSIYVLKKKIEEKKNDAQKNILLDALCISNTVYKRLIQYVPDINNLKEENINPESFASSKKYYDTDTDSYYSEYVPDINNLKEENINPNLLQAQKNTMICFEIV